MQATVVAAKGIRVAAPHESTQSRLRERIRLQCNFGTTKPDARRQSFREQRIKTGAWVAYGGIWVFGATSLKVRENFYPKTRAVGPNARIVCCGITPRDTASRIPKCRASGVQVTSRSIYSALEESSSFAC